MLLTHSQSVPLIVVAIVASVILLGLLLALLATSKPHIINRRARTIAANRKRKLSRVITSQITSQYQSVRYTGPPDSVPVELSGIQPPERRRSSLTAATLSLCSSNNPEPNFLGHPRLSQRRATYGSIELMRSSGNFNQEQQKYSGQRGRASFCATSTSLMPSDSSQIAQLARICEESNDINFPHVPFNGPVNPLYHNGQKQRRSSSSSVVFDNCSTTRSSISTTDSDLFNFPSDNNTTIKPHNYRSSSVSISNHDELFMLANSSGSSVGLGRLFFIVSFNPCLNTLYVTVTKAANVRSSLIREMSCIYVKISLLPTDLGYPIHRTSYVTSMGSPMFNQTFTFQLHSNPKPTSNLATPVNNHDSNISASSPPSLSLEPQNNSVNIIISNSDNLLTPSNYSSSNYISDYHSNSSLSYGFSDNNHSNSRSNSDYGNNSHDDLDKENSNQTTNQLQYFMETHQQLQFTIKEVRKFDSNRVIGYVWFDLNKIFKEAIQRINSNQGVVAASINNNNNNNNNNSNDKFNSNYGMVDMIYYELSRDIFGENRSYQRRGDALISLKITPSVVNGISLRNTMAAIGEIEINISEARNLHLKHQNNYVYVRASLIIQNKVLQTKKGHNIKSRDSKSPSFNDRFRFVVPNLTDGKVNVETIKFEKDVFVLLCFCSRSRLRMNSKLIGRCMLGGSNCNGISENKTSDSSTITMIANQSDGNILWHEALSKPGHPISNWLCLD